MAQHGKKYQDAAKLVDRTRVYAPGRGGRSRRSRRRTVKFDASVEAHLRLGVDPRHADQMVRGTVVLPARHGQGRPRRRVRPGREGAGGPARRRRRGRRRGPRQEDRGRLARVRRRDRDPGHDGQVGKPRPHPRPPRPHAEPQGGHRHVRHRARGRARSRPAASSSRSTRARSSTSPSARRASTSSRWSTNLAALVDAINRAKPSGAKGQYLRALTIASTMGPGIRVDIPAVLAAANA